MMEYSGKPKVLIILEIIIIMTVVGRDYVDDNNNDGTNIGDTSRNIN
jgi:hypothetical protein